LEPPHLFNTLLFVTGELEFFFIAPENGRSGLSLSLSQNWMQIDNLNTY
jgi:hypothetical protein